VYASKITFNRYTTMNTPALLSGSALLVTVVVASLLLLTMFVLGMFTGRQKGKSNTETSDDGLSGPNTKFMLTLSQDAIVITDGSQKILNMNASFRALLNSDIVLNDQNLSDLLRFASSTGEQITPSTLAKFTNSDMVSHDQLYILDGANQKIEISVKIFKMHTKQGNGAFIWKITNKTAEKDTEKRQSEFISVISHELRTPVAVMEASTSSLLSNTNESLSPSQAKLVNATRENALLLSKLLADLSVYSTLQNNAITAEMKSVSPRMILDQMQKVFTTQAEEKGLVLVVDHDQNVRSVISGEAHILSILQNFIKNALQFSKTGDIVIVSTKAVSDGVVFMVRDTGSGIPEQQRDHVFESTFHANTDTQHQTLQGAGVGLYISAQLAKAIGASVWVESEPSKGSSFFLKVPITYDNNESKTTVHNLEINKFAQDI